MKHVHIRNALVLFAVAGAIIFSGPLLGDLAQPLDPVAEKILYKGLIGGLSFCVLFALFEMYRWIRSASPSWEAAVEERRIEQAEYVARRERRKKSGPERRQYLIDRLTQELQNPNLPVAKRQELQEKLDRVSAIDRK